MNYMAVGSKKDRNCVTCQYWSSKNCIRVKSPNFFEFDRRLTGECRLTGFTTKAFNSCGKYQRRDDF